MIPDDPVERDVRVGEFPEGLDAVRDDRERGRPTVEQIARVDDGVHVFADCAVDGRVEGVREVVSPDIASVLTIPKMRIA